jgi:hypothetical protein
VLADIERNRFRYPDPPVRIAQLASLSRATLRRVPDRHEKGGFS